MANIAQAFQSGLQAGESIRGMPEVFAQQDLGTAQAQQGLTDIQTSKAATQYLAGLMSGQQTPQPSLPMQSSATPTGTLQGSPTQPTLPLQQSAGVASSAPGGYAQKDMSGGHYSEGHYVNPALTEPPRNEEGMYRQAAMFAAKLGSPAVFEQYNKMAEQAKANYQSDVKNYLGQVNGTIDEVSRTVDTAQSKTDIINSLQSAGFGNTPQIRQLEAAVMAAPDLESAKQVVKNATMSVKDQTKAALDKMKVEETAKLKGAELEAKLRHDAAMEATAADRASSARVSATANLLRAKTEQLRLQKSGGTRNNQTLNQAIHERDQAHSQYMSEYNRLSSAYTKTTDPQYKADIAQQIKTLNSSYSDFKNQLESEWKDRGLSISPKASQKEPTQFEEGKVYTDANGNQARYENGKWIPVE